MAAVLDTDDGVMMKTLFLRKSFVAAASLRADAANVPNRKDNYMPGPMAHHGWMDSKYGCGCCTAAAAFVAAAASTLLIPCCCLYCPCCCCPAAAPLLLLLPMLLLLPLLLPSAAAAAVDAAADIIDCWSADCTILNTQVPLLSLVLLQTLPRLLPQQLSTVSASAVGDRFK